MSNKDKPMLQMIEIYSGNSPDWKGWYNLCLKNGEDDYAIAGPVHPETSAMILKALDYHDGKSYIDLIQDEANEAAQHVTKLEALLREAECPNNADLDWPCNTDQCDWCAKRDELLTIGEG